MGMGWRVPKMEVWRPRKMPSGAGELGHGFWPSSWHLLHAYRSVLRLLEGPSPQEFPLPQGKTHSRCPTLAGAPPSPSQSHGPTCFGPLEHYFLDFLELTWPLLCHLGWSHSIFTCICLISTTPWELGLGLDHYVWLNSASGAFPEGTMLDFLGTWTEDIFCPEEALVKI